MQYFHIRNFNGKPFSLFLILIVAMTGCKVATSSSVVLQSSSAQSTIDTSSASDYSQSIQSSNVSYVYPNNDQTKYQIPLIISTDHPKLQLSQVILGGENNHSAGIGSDYIVFKSIYHVFDTSRNESGFVYGLSEHFRNSLTQSIYKSTDNGNLWLKVGDLEINQANGIWYEKIFVEPIEETFYLLKITNGGNSPAINEIISLNSSLEILGCLKIGNRKWLSGNHNIDSCLNKITMKKTVIFGEYDTEDTMSENLNLWRTTDRGLTWVSVLKQKGNEGVRGSGEIRHFHAVQTDPFINDDWWAASGDQNHQNKIWKSSDGGLTWNLIFSGSQRERTCSFVFEKKYIYYGMDSQSMSETAQKIIRIDRKDYSRAEIGCSYLGFSIYALTRTISPAGFIVWICSEPGFLDSDKLAIQFYDYETEELKNLAYISLNETNNTEYRGFQGASRCQDVLSGTLFVQPTINLAQGKYGWSSVSRFFKANLSS